MKADVELIITDEEYYDKQGVLSEIIYVGRPT